MSDNLVGTWKTRSGHIAEVLLKGYSSEHRQLVFMGKMKNDMEIDTLYWDLNGNSLINKGFDLMERGGGDKGDVFDKKHT